MRRTSRLPDFLQRKRETFMTESSPLPDPHTLLQPLTPFVAEEMSAEETHTASHLVADILGNLSAFVRQKLADAGATEDEVACEFFPDPDEPDSPGHVLFWPKDESGDDLSAEAAQQAEYSLRLTAFLPEREDVDVVYPPGISMVLKFDADACELLQVLPPSVFEQLEFRLKGQAPMGFEFLDDSQNIPVMPHMRRQFLKAIERAHAVTRKTGRKKFESVMLHYIWDEVEPQPDFAAVLSTLVSLFAAVHWKAMS